MAATGLEPLGDEIIGGYRVVRTLLRGQSCDILEVVQEGTGRRFALKQLREAGAAVGDERRAFAFEAKLGMEMSHPNLIRVYEFVRGPMPYFVMEYFPSLQLRPMITFPEKYPTPPDRIRKIINQAATALIYMHEKGWTHRDIKPENILVNKVGETRVIDYALAMRIPSGIGKLFSGKPPRQGTPSYIAPDTILRRPPSISADVYSFGVTCYELSCGRQPFRADSQGDLLKKHLKERPTSPITHNKRVTPEYSDLILSMLAKDPAKRPANLREFLAGLRKVKIFHDEPIPVETLM